MNKGRLKKIFASAVVVVAAVVGNEISGYSSFDNDYGQNLACKVDLSCRHLTRLETNLAYEFFGGQIDYTKAKIFSRPWLWVHFNIGAMAPNGNIYIHADEHKKKNFGQATPGTALFIHEMTHVWQAQQGVNMPMAALWEWIKSGFDYSKPYKYCIDECENFDDYGIEQQARIIEEIYRMRYLTSIEEKDTPEFCETLQKHEEKVGQALPIKPYAGCVL